MTTNDSPAAPRRWGLPHAVLTFVVAYVLSVSCALSWAAATGHALDSLGTTAAGLVGLWAGFGGGAWLLARYRGSGSLADDFGVRFRFPADLLGIPLGYLSQIVVALVVALPAQWWVEDADEKLRARAENIADRAGGDAAFFVLAVLLVVGAPFFEELFYRGMVLQSLARWLPSAAAVVVTAALFAAVHDAPTTEAYLLQALGLTTFAVILGTIVVRTGRLGLAVTTHAAFNLFTVIGLYRERLR